MTWLVIWSQISYDGESPSGFVMQSFMYERRTDCRFVASYFLRYRNSNDVITMFLFLRHTRLSEKPVKCLKK